MLKGCSYFNLISPTSYKEFLTPFKLLSNCFTQLTSVEPLLYQR